MAGLLSGSTSPEQRAVLQGGASWPRIWEQRRTAWLADGRVRRCIQVPFMVVRRMGRSSGRRQAAGDSRTASFRAESSQWSILAGSSGESVRQVSRKWLRALGYLSIKWSAAHEILSRACLLSFLPSNIQAQGRGKRDVNARDLKEFFFFGIT